MKPTETSANQRAPAATPWWVLPAGMGLACVALLVWGLVFRLPVVRAAATVHADPGEDVEPLPMPEVQIEVSEDSLKQLREQHALRSELRFLDRREDLLALLNTFEEDARRLEWRVDASFAADAAYSLSTDEVVRHPATLRLRPLESDLRLGGQLGSLLTLVRGLYASEKKMELVQLKINSGDRGITDAELIVCFWLKNTHEKTATE